MKKTEQHIRNLLEKTIDLDELEVEINKLKPRFSQFDEDLVQQLQQKYNDGREIQQSCRVIIQSALENEFTEEGIKTIEVFIKDAKKLNLDLPEFHRLETVKYIPKWVNRIHSIVCDNYSGKKSASKETNTQSQQNSQGGSGAKKEPKIKKLKPLRTLRQEVMKGLDVLEPSKMAAQMKQDLAETLTKNVPQVLDEELNKLLQKVQLILWNKDAYDLLVKESIALTDLILLKDNPAKNEHNFRYLKFKQITYHNQISELIKQAEAWMSKASQIEQKFPLEEINSDRNKFEQFKKALEGLKKGMNNTKIEKITEVKEKFNFIQQQQLQIEWALDCGEYLRNDSERKKLEDLENYYRRAESCKVSKQWSTFSALETLYTQVKELVVKSKKLTGNKQEEKMDIEKDNDSLEIMDYEKKQKELSSKVTLDELDQLLQRMKDLNDRVDFDSQVEFLEQSKKNQEKYIQMITRCYNAHWSQMENFQDTPSEDLLEIRNQINSIAKLESTILVALPKFDSYFLKLFWSIDCAFFQSSSTSIKMKRDLEQCKKLVNASSVIRDIENSKLYKKLNEQLNVFLKCKDAVDLLKKDAKKKKSEEREQFINMKQFSELENALRTLTIEESKSSFKEIQKMKRKLEQIIAEYEEAVKKNEKQPLKFWKELLDQFHSSKIPVKCDEEFLLEVLIKDAEEMETELKAAKKSTGSASKKGSSAQQQLSPEIIELLERYRLQQVKLPEAEKLLEKWKIKEDSLSIIEKKVYGSNELSQEEIRDLKTQINNLKSQFSGERMVKLDQEIYLKRIMLLKEYWDKNKEIEVSFEEMKETLKSTIAKFEGRTETRFQQAIQFIKGSIEKCEDRIKQIEEISNPKELETCLKHTFSPTLKSLKFVGYIDMTQQIVDKLARLKLEIEKQKQKESDKKQKEKQIAKERQEKMEEERKQKLQSDSKKKEDIKKRDIDEKSKDKLQKERKHTAQMKQNMISDISKAINETWKNLTLQDCLQYGTTLVERLFTENSSQISNTLDSVVAFAKLFLELKKLPNICAQVRKMKFDFNELNRLLKLSLNSKKVGAKNTLEKEEKIIEINTNIAKKEKDLILDVKFKKKEIPGETNQIEGSVPSKKLKSDSIALSLLFNDSVDAYTKDKQEDSSYVNIDSNNMVKQSIAKIREGKITTMSKGASNKSKTFGAKFSDDEDDSKSENQEYVPLREEDFQSLNESLILQHHKQMKEKQNQFLQFNPDDENLSQKQDEAPDSASVISLLKGSFEAQLPNNGQPCAINKLYVLTCDDAKECMVMPAYPMKNQALSLKGFLSINNFSQYHGTLVQERQLNPERKTRFVSGWFESESIEDRQILENFANQLKHSKRVAVIEWAAECKLYILHRDSWNTKGNEGFQIKFKRNFFHHSNYPNDTLLYIMIFKQHKLPNQNYETIRPIFMQKRCLPPTNPIQMQVQTAQPVSALTESGKKLSKIVNNYIPEKNTSQSVKHNIQAELDNSFTRGKKSFNKMSLETLTMNDGSFMNDEDEEQHLNDKLVNLRNQIYRMENKVINQTSQNTFQKQNQRNNPLQPPHLQNQPPHLQNQQQGSYQQQIHQQQQSASSRYNTAQKQQGAYPRSANRSGVNTPSYYEKNYAPLVNEPPHSYNSYSNQSFQQQQQQYNKPAYQRTLNFNNKLNDSMDVEDYNLSFRGSVFNSQSQSQQAPFHQSQSQQAPFHQSQSQQINPHSYMNSQQNSQEMFFKKPQFNGPVKGFKRTYGTTKQMPERMNQRRSNENLSQGSQETMNFQNILKSLDQTMKELIKNQEQKTNDTILNSLLQQSQQQQQLIQQLQKQTNSQSQGVNSQQQQLQANSNNLQLQGEKKKKTRKRTKKRTANAAGLNNSLSVDGSMMSDESQESVPRSIQNSQTFSQQSQSRNIQVQNKFQAPGQYQKDNYFNSKKDVKIFDKQTQKLTNQHERTTNTTTTTTLQQFGIANTQQPHFSKNNQTLKQENTTMQHHPFQTVGVNHQKEQEQRLTPQIANITNNSSSTTSTNNNNKQSLNQTIPSLNYSNSIMAASSTNLGSSSNQANKSNQGAQQIQQPTIKFTTTGPTTNLSTNQERIQSNAPYNQQLPQNNQLLNSLTALNQIHLTKISQKNSQMQNSQTQVNSSQNSQTHSINPLRAQMIVKDNLSQFSQEQTAVSNTNTQETNKIMGIRDISTRITSSNNITATNNTQNHRLHPSLAFKKISKEFDMDLEVPTQQQTATNNHSINHSLERHLLTDLSKSGRVNQEKNNSFLTLRGEIKETNNSSNNSEIPRYLKEKSVRNPTFYPVNKDNKQNQQDSIQPKKTAFSYSSVGSRDGSIEKSQDKPFGFEKENSYRRLY